MSAWTHSICDDCWDKRNPMNKSPRKGMGALELCCYCDDAHRSGIYVRDDPKTTPCHGHGQLQEYMRLQAKKQRETIE